MRGIVFSEFLGFVDVTHPASRPALPPTFAGDLNPTASYPEHCLREMVAEVAARTGESSEELLRSFGTFLFPRFAAIYPVFFRGTADPLAFLSKVHDSVHEDLRRFHPDAEVPELRCEWEGRNQLDLEYRSPRGLADLAEGLILGCIAHFGEAVSVRREDLPGPRGQAVRFTLRRAQPAVARAASASG